MSDHGLAPAHVERARIWYRAHREHVDLLVAISDAGGYPPSGSDISQPELWKPAHWRWFLHLQEQVGRPLRPAPAAEEHQDA